MPELYTFTTERTTDKEGLRELASNLKQEGFDFTIHVIPASVWHDEFEYIIGHAWCTDCGYPMELYSCFDGLEINCVFCNNNDYGIINKNPIYSGVTDETKRISK